ncbi:MAG: histidine--tRNA ligase [Aestuariivita sp.]|nr:histidine--tRNA ligase [Aestuariivita sp.]MCY4346561.1 histidine--tRNA ligase [Aestuariivita sp.]
MRTLPLVSKAEKKRRPKAEQPKGFRDYFGTAVLQRMEVLRRIEAVYQSYGFDPLETSAVETVEALGKYLPDVERPNEGIFAWQEDDTWLALRYDLTAPLSRVYAQYRQQLPQPYRRYAMGPVWRNEKPGLGRYRQFYQCDADTVGSASIAADAEICAMLGDTLEAIGILRSDYIIKINHRKLLNGVLETAGLRDQNERDAVLRTIDKFDKVGVNGVRQLLGTGRLDSSGAFIEGIGLSDLQIEAITDFLTAYSGDDSVCLKDLRSRVEGAATGREGVDELEKISELLAAQGYGDDRVTIDTAIVRGLGYYTGAVFEAELTSLIRDNSGRQQRFGAVAGGGRYDDLVKRFVGQAVPATGVSIGIDRLFAALEVAGQFAIEANGPVLVTVMDRERMTDYQTMAAELRQAGVRAEVYLGNPKNFGNQLKYADRRNSPAAIIEGTDERARGVVQIKDLRLGAEIAKTANLEEWQQRPSQVEVVRDEMVSKIQEILEKKP